MAGRKAGYKGGDAGMTLVEVMIAFGLLTLLFMGMLASFIMGKRAEGQGTTTMEIMHYARSIQEGLRGEDFYSAALSVGTHSISGGYYSVSNTVGFASTKDVYITVFWTDPGTFRTSTVTIATSMSEAMRE